MYQYFDTLTDVSGNALLGATVLVTNYPSGTLASIYQSNGTTLPIANSTLVSDITGQISFFVPDGAYTLTYSYKGTQYKVRSPLQIGDPLAFVAATDTGSASSLIVSGAQYSAQLYIGLKLEVKVAAKNTGATTLTYQGGAPQPVNLPGGFALPAGTLQANGLVRLEWDGTQWQCVGGGASTSVFYDITPAENAVSAVITNYTRVPGDVVRYSNADPTGVTDSTAAFNTAIAQWGQAGGAEVIFDGTFLTTTGIVVTVDGLCMRGMGIGRSRLLAGANSINVLKIGAASCLFFGGFEIAGNGKTGVHGLVLAPSNEAGGPIVKVNNNTIMTVRIRDCAEGVRLRTGVTSFDQLYFNGFFDIETVDCIRSLWFQANGTTSNRNYFYNHRGGSTGLVANTGCQIDAGSGNKFYGLEFEGMLNGASPNAVPTGILIGATSANDSNQFFGAQTEACTRGCENKNALTEFYGCSIFGTTNFVYTAQPLIFLGGSTASNLVQFTEAFLLQNNNQIAGRTNAAIALRTAIAGMQFNAIQVSSSDVNTLDDYKEGTWTPVIAGATTPGTQTYGTQLGKYTKSGRTVTASGTIVLTAKGGTIAGAVTITGLPYAAVTGAGNAHGMIAGFSNITFPANFTQMGVYLPGSTSVINLIRSGSAQVLSNVDATELSNTSYIEFTMQYQTAT